VMRAGRRNDEIAGRRHTHLVDGRPELQVRLGDAVADIAVRLEAVDGDVGRVVVGQQDVLFGFIQRDEDRPMTEPDSWTSFRKPSIGEDVVDFDKMIGPRILRGRTGLAQRNVEARADAVRPGVLHRRRGQQRLHRRQRAGGGVERLPATATVLGAFEAWDCSVAEAVLAPGDTLLLYSDGITEASSDEGEEFGETRLMDALGRHRHLEAPALVAAILRTVREFSGRVQEDDITLLAARCR